MGSRPGLEVRVPGALRRVSFARTVRPPVVQDSPLTLAVRWFVNGSFIKREEPIVGTPDGTVRGT
ncbi:MAG: hypothetical protein OEO20_16310 [Gemmatimonadota bacterium]|nr:hypothetical protein [Gemmatimonadota bacterium]MDH3479860.1 hypothetical protein [Gemmatimonadota bacterium]MDH3571849.1 hypothetical protein [Gemmatimonadota bacterium]MDH5550221.1 hypothetical protein [Gemmatimonadota bacterium]